MDTQGHRTQMQVGDVVPDGTSDGVLVKVFVPSANFAIAIHHGLGRVPIKAHVVEAQDRVINCYVAFKSAEQIQLVFDAAPGTALVRIA